MSNKSDKVSIVVFIDALGWEVLRNRRFLEEELPFRSKLRSVFGFSSACVPSILTGNQPRDHGHWSFFYHTRERSPFRPLRMLRWLPGSLADRGRVRNWISKLVKRAYGFKGYFQLYNMPFRLIDRFDYCEKRDLFRPGGMNKGESIFDRLERSGTKYHCSDWRQGEDANLESLKASLAEGEIPFAFLYMASMDALLHQVGKSSDQVDAKLEWYEQRLRELMALAREHYDEVRLFVCSDHGMATVEHTVDIGSQVDALGLNEGRDFIATYDSTMARFWFNSDEARRRITALLNTIPEGRILPDKELAALGCDFDGQQYGELIFLLDAGVLIVPSHMGTKPITGMHGYHPDHPDSDASLLSNVPPPVRSDCITDVFHIMRAEAGV
jgi:predicted AlkP superfamily pyrophosphatase or phosphodiesterase